jgi:hypothetical protein
VASMLHEGNTDLDEFEPSFQYTGGIERVDGHYRHSFPIGSALVALPLIWLFDSIVEAASHVSFPSEKLNKGISNWRKHFGTVGLIDAPFFFVTEMVLASLLMALASVLIQWTASEFMSWNKALWVTVAFAFGSAVFSTASRDLGQHGPSVLMTSAALLLLFRGRRVASAVPWAGLFVALSYVMRPTNSLSVVVLTLLVALRFPKKLLGFLGCAAPVAIAFAVYNLTVYGTFLSGYYQPQRIIPRDISLFGEALAGNLVSPGRGLLLYSPVFLFSVAGAVRALKAKDFRLEATLFSLLVVLHWLTVSAFPHWWAGYSYGPRYMTDMTPFLCMLVGFWLKEQPFPSKTLRFLAFAAALGISCFTHARGATSNAAVEWNARPLDIDTHPERLWSFDDLPFLRGL